VGRIRFRYFARVGRIKVVAVGGKAKAPAVEERDQRRGSRLV